MIKEAAVIGAPDEILGQAVMAFIVGNGQGPVDMADLAGFCSTKLPRYMMPKSFHILPSLPKTPNGKIDYTNLQAKRVTPDA